MDSEYSEMERNITSLHRKLRDNVYNSWNRVLPFNELVGDRWEKARYLGFGEKTSIFDSSVVLGDVKVGSNTWIGPFTILDGSGGLKIGDFCSISSGVQIYSHDSVKWALSGGKAEYERESVSIGNYCYIGSMSIIAKGTIIGERCVIGANSFVNKSIHDNSIVAGSPAKLIGKVIVDAQGNVSLTYFNKNNT